MGLADERSKVFNDDLEWSLSTIFARILAYYPELSVDTFALRLNCKLTNYVSCTAEPHVMAVDAFYLH